MNETSEQIMAMLQQAVQQHIKKLLFDAGEISIDKLDFLITGQTAYAELDWSVTSERAIGITSNDDDEIETKTFDNMHDAMQWVKERYNQGGDEIYCCSVCNAKKATLTSAYCTHCGSMSDTIIYPRGADTPPVIDWGEEIPDAGSIIRRFFALDEGSENKDEVDSDDESAL